MTVKKLKKELEELEEKYDMECKPINDLEPLVPVPFDILERWLDLQNQIEQMRIEEIIHSK